MQVRRMNRVLEVNVDDLDTTLQAVRHGNHRMACTSSRSTDMPFGLRCSVPMLESVFPCPM
jgi:hypothetical protein